MPYSVWAEHRSFCHLLAEAVAARAVPGVYACGEEVTQEIGWQVRDGLRVGIPFPGIVGGREEVKVGGVSAVLGTDLKGQLPLAPNSAHGVQAQDLRLFQKLNKRLVQVVDNGLRLPICSIGLRSG